MYIDYISIDWNKISSESYLTRIPAICLLQKLRLRKPVTFFVGENGSGKSTLLEAIAKQYALDKAQELFPSVTITDEATR